MSTEPAYSPDPRLAKAAETIARQLGLPAGDVKISVGRQPLGDGGDMHRHGGSLLSPAEGTEQLIVTIHREGLDLERPRFTDEIRDKLAALAPLAEVAQMVPPEQLAARLRSDLEAVTKDTSFNKQIFEWPGFNPELVKKGAVSDYAVQNVRSDTYGVTMNLRFPEGEGVADQSAAIERFSEITKGRLEAIKAIMTDRVVKYARANISERGLNAQERQEAEAKAAAGGKTAEAGVAHALAEKIALAEAEIRRDMAKLQISVNRDGNHLAVMLRSPEQSEAYNKADPQTRDYAYSPPANADDLRNTNPLTSRIVSLTTEPSPATDARPERQPQLSRALARSFLFDQDKNIAPDALQIFGTRDVKAAIFKEAHKSGLLNDPAKKQAIEKILDSELLKNHASWMDVPGKAGTAKLAPVFSKPEQGGHDMLEIAFTLRQDKEPEKNQVLQVVGKLSGAAGPVPPAAPASTSLHQVADQMIATGEALSNVGGIAMAGAGAETQLGAIKGPKDVSKELAAAVSAVAGPNAASLAAAATR